MSKKKKAKANVGALTDLGKTGVALMEAVPGMKQLLKPMRRLAKATGYTKLITG